MRRREAEPDPLALGEQALGQRPRPQLHRGRATYASENNTSDVRAVHRTSACAASGSGDTTVRIPIVIAAIAAAISASNRGPVIALRAFMRGTVRTAIGMPRQIAV